MTNLFPSGICLHDVLALAQRLKSESGFEDNAAYDAALRALTPPARPSAALPVLRQSQIDVQDRIARRERKWWLIGDRRSSPPPGQIRHLRGKRRPTRRTMFRRPL